MVFIVRKSRGFETLRKIYDKSSWYKFKTVYKQLYQANPVLAALTTATLIAYPFIIGMVTYVGTERNKNPPKYHFHVTVVRPDDPKVKKIPKVDNLYAEFLETQPTLYLHSV
ncbi:hypothetical protein ANTPLA_LOCUS3319 [Anthophora plagiata]